MPGEGSGTVVHDAGIVIAKVKSSCLVRRHFSECTLKTLQDITGNDTDVIVPVLSAMFVKEAQCMTYFMDNNRQDNTSDSEIYSLRLKGLWNSTNKGAAAVKKKEKYFLKSYEKLLLKVIAFLLETYPTPGINMTE